jgi:hypothetical protein
LEETCEVLKDSEGKIVKENLVLLAQILAENSNFKKPLILCFDWLTQIVVENSNLKKPLILSFDWLTQIVAEDSNLKNPLV